MSIRKTTTSPATSNLAQITRVYAPSGQNGLGASSQVFLSDINGNEQVASAVETIWEDSTDLYSGMRFKLRDSVGIQDKISIFSSGTVRLEDYGQGNKINDPVYGLGVNSTGNIVETPISSGSLVYVARINGSFLGGVSLIEIENTTGATFTISALLAGYYEIGCSNSSLFNRNNAVVFGTLSDGTPRVFTATIAAATAAITIQTLNFSGAPADGINLAMIKIEIYP
jgi:hypothetical protein